ncbi:MAG: hypothetical protein DMG12_04310 [Acidobacteria bacterium]|nr:MAG: hypothetical protein DMG12_04310 [Acidobacteriota bacterium]
MIASTLKGKILVFAVFFVGIAAGVLVADVYQSRVTGTREDVTTRDRAQRAQRDVSKFDDYLGLNEQQRQQVNKILEETRNEFQALRKETQPRFQAIQEESRVKIRALLTNEQRQKYDEFRRARDQRRKNRDRDSDHDRQRPD